MAIRKINHNAYLHEWYKCQGSGFPDKRPHVAVLLIGDLQMEVLDFASLPLEDAASLLSRPSLADCVAITLMQHTSLSDVAQCIMSYCNKVCRAVQHDR